MERYRIEHYPHAQYKYRLAVKMKWWPHWWRCIYDSISESYGYDFCLDTMLRRIARSIPPDANRRFVYFDENGKEIQHE